jgi:SGNH hydrolase-like domain, acetyltransferase AlgX
VDRAATILAKRRVALKQKNIEYLKFVVPEKAVVYPEFMPKVFSGKEPNTARPATKIAGKKLDNFQYLEDVLKDAKSFGQLYFRGDSHPNWLGSYFVYYSIVSRMNEVLGRQGFSVKAPMRLCDLEPFLASYGGDLFSQLDLEMKNLFNGAWGPLSLGDKLEHTVGLKIFGEKRKAKALDVDSAYADKITERKTFKFEGPNENLPRAVIFRDSTSDFLVDLLGEHFSNSIFIWHKGFVYQDVIDREKPDIVLHIMAERFLTQYEEVKPFYNLFDE